MAAASVGDEIFNRATGGYDSDFLDDTALITAFDNAVNPIKAMLGDTALINAASKANGYMQPKKKKHKKNKKSKQKGKPRPSGLPADTQATTGWKIGQHCRCVYTEDGLTYDAVIVSIDQDVASCVVRYEGYGNEEQQRLCDLIPPLHAGSRQRQSSHSTVMSDKDDVDDSDSAPADRRNDSFLFSRPHSRKESSHKNKKHTSRAAPNWFSHHMPPSFGYPGFCPYPPMVPPYSQVPPFCSYMSQSFPRMPPPPPCVRLPGIPVIPPPPPPQLMADDESDTDKEALYSMLIAWYMSGYHTGYYEGVKRRGKHTRGGPVDGTDLEEGTSTSTADAESSVTDQR